MRRIIFAAVAVIMCSACARADAKAVLPDGDHWAVVNTSSAYMRAETRYSSECVSQTRMGTLVQVLERKGYWVKVRTPEPYEGWINELALAPTSALSASQQKEAGEWSPKLRPLTRTQAEGYLRKPKYICTAEYTHVFAGPSDSSGRVSDLLMSDIILCREAPAHEDWLAVETPQGEAGWVRESEVEPFAGWAARRWGEIHGGSKMDGGRMPEEQIAQQLIGRAKLFMGVPYMWGGMSVKGFDCSGLVGLCYFMQGILLPRDASQQVLCGEEVAFADMQPGDLIFFGNTSVGHVGMYIGEGRMIHSSQIVRINSLDPSQPDYYGRNILHIRRILGHVDDGTGAISTKSSNLYFER